MRHKRLTRVTVMLPVTRQVRTLLRRIEDVPRFHYQPAVRHVKRRLRF